MTIFDNNTAKGKREREREIKIIKKKKTFSLTFDMSMVPGLILLVSQCKGSPVDERRVCLLDHLTFARVFVQDFGDQ